MAHAHHSYRVLHGVPTMRHKFHLVRRKVADRPNGVDDPIAMRGRPGQEIVEDCIKVLITMNRTFISSNHSLQLSTNPCKTQSITITFFSERTFSAAVATRELSDNAHVPETLLDGPRVRGVMIQNRQ